MGWKERDEPDNIGRYAIDDGMSPVSYVFLNA